MHCISLLMLISVNTFTAFVFLPQYNNLEVFHLSEQVETIAPEGKLSFVQLFSHSELL